MEKYLQQIKDLLIGKKIIDIRYMTEEEADQMGWTKRPLIIFLKGGEAIYASADNEGNNGGAMFTTNDEVPVIGTI